MPLHAGLCFAPVFKAYLVRINHPDVFVELRRTIHVCASFVDYYAIQVRGDIFLRLSLLSGTPRHF